jgi:chromosome segregation ATPase
MSWPLVWRRSAEAELADAKAEIRRQRTRAEKAEDDARTAISNRQTIAGQYSDLYDRHDRAVRSNKALSGQLEAAQVGGGFDAAKAKQTADRIAHLTEEAARAREELRTERGNNTRLARQVNTLQKRLDDAVGLTSSGIKDSAPWQPGYQQPKPDKEASTS